MAFYFDDEEAGVHAYFPDGEEDAGAEWVRDYLASVTPPAADVTDSYCAVCYHYLSDSDTCTVETCEHRRAPITRAEVVKAALDEDDALFEASLDTPDAHAAMMEIVHEAYAELEGDARDYEEAMEREIEDTAEMFAELHAQSLDYWATAQGRRRHAKNRRSMAIMRGARPYVPAYDLAWDVEVFDGEIYRIIDIPV